VRWLDRDTSTRWVCGSDRRCCRGFRRRRLPGRRHSAARPWFHRGARCRRGSTQCFGRRTGGPAATGRQCWRPRRHCVDAFIDAAPKRPETAGREEAAPEGCVSERRPARRVNHTHWFRPAYKCVLPRLRTSRRGRPFTTLRVVRRSRLVSRPVRAGEYDAPFSRESQSPAPLDHQSRPPFRCNKSGLSRGQPSVRPRRQFTAAPGAQPARRGLSARNRPRQPVDDAPSPRRLG
jgi:hypothetical protein